MMDKNPDRPLSADEKKALLTSARAAIEKAVANKNPEPLNFDSPVLHENRGLFVTLHKKGDLRGCIGYVQAYKPLIDTVREMAVAAAQRDPRFTPVEADELVDMDIELSVLSPLREIVDVADIKVGTHGLYIKKGPYTGLLLPQVAVEYKWDREQFLEQTCQKAGLPHQAWKEKDTTIMIFSAQVFGEE